MTLRVLDLRDVIAAGGDSLVAAMADMRNALTMLRTGDAEMPPETSVRLGPPHVTQAHAYALPARVGDRAGVKWTAHATPGSDPLVQSVTVISDAICGRPIGVIESAQLTAVRSASTSAFMLRARPPCRVALLGAGAQARAHLRMLAELFPSLECVTVWNRTRSRAVAMTAEPTPWPVKVAANPEAALDGSDCVLTCTNAANPILGAGAVRSGRTVLQIGYHEVTFDAIDQADSVVVDLWGEFRMTSAKSLFRMHRAGRFDAARVEADLAALALDEWRPTPEAAVYFSSFGLSIFDIALAARVLREAEARGIGVVHEMVPYLPV